MNVRFLILAASLHCIQIRILWQFMSWKMLKGHWRKNTFRSIFQVPTKCVASTQNFAVKCGVQFIDFEGRTDGKLLLQLHTLVIKEHNDDITLKMSSFPDRLHPGVKRNAEICSSSCNVLAWLRSCWNGFHSGESIFKLLQQLRPRRTILVRGSQQSLNSLRDFCSEVLLPFTNQRWCPVFFPGPASSWLFLV